MIIFVNHLFFKPWCIKYDCDNFEIRQTIKCKKINSEIDINMHCLYVKYVQTNKLIKTNVNLKYDMLIILMILKSNATSFRIRLDKCKGQESFKRG